jgi:uncharacterized membrane protein YbhN (UPF0104 family)
LYLFNGQILRQAQRVHSLDLPFWENLALTYATSAINYYLPLKGAMGLRAYYLKTQFKLPVTDFLSQITLIGLISLCLSSFFALIGLLQMGVQGRLGTILCLYFLAVCLLGTSLIFVAKLPFKLPKFLTGPLNSWDSFRQNPRTLISIVCLDILYYLMWCLGHWFSLRSFNIHLNLWETLFYAGGQIHSLLINLTPAGLGVMEAFSVFAGQILNFSPAEALLAQGLNRFSAICVLGVLGTISWGYLLYLKRKKSKNLDS